MFSIKQNSLMLLVFLALTVALTGCITEGQTSQFKEPTEEDLSKALNNYVEMSYEYIQLEKYTAAIRSVKRALEIDAKSPLANNALAIVYQSQGDTKEAERSFKKSLSYDRDFTTGRMNYGEFLFAEKRYVEACEQFKKASEDNFYPKRAGAFYNLGRCFEIRNMKNESIHAYQRSLGISPSHAGALLSTAFMAFDNGNFPESKKLFDKHAEVNREKKINLTAEAVLLGIKLERRFGNRDAEASRVIFLKNMYPYSKEYLEYQSTMEGK